MAENKNYDQKGQGKSSEKNPGRSNTSGSSQGESSRHHGLGSVDEDLQQNVSSGNLGQARSRQDQPDFDSGTSHKGQSSSKMEGEDRDTDFSGTRKGTSTGQVGSDVGANRRNQSSSSSNPGGSHSDSKKSESSDKNLGNRNG